MATFSHLHALRIPSRGARPCAHSGIAVLAKQLPWPGAAGSAARLPRTTAPAIGFALAALFALALSLTCLLIAPSAAVADNADRPAVQWIEKGSRIYCKVDGVAQKGGLRTIAGRSYLFDAKGRQLTGWRKVGRHYRYFTVATKAKGAMVTGKVVNGVRLDKQGRAVLNDQAKAELGVLTKATAFVERNTKPAWSQKKKLRTCFNLLRDKYSERAFRSFSSKSGWQRAFALDIFNKKSGSCHSYAAAFAYIANAIGCKNCKVVSSGGHSWAEVDGKVYDPEWAKHCRVDLFAFPYARSGQGGTPGYKNARSYVVTIAPRAKALSGKASATSSRFAGKRGLVKMDGARYYVQNGKAVKKQWKTVKGAKYYFLANGKAATGPTKIKGTWYVFSQSGKLLTGNKTRLVKVAGNTYRVTKSGRAKAGWDNAKVRRFAQNGQMMTGTVAVGEKFCAFSAKGHYDAAKTKRLRAAARIDTDAAPLLKLLGSPQKRTYSASCYQMVDANGNSILGDDGRLVYPHFTVFTFKADNGVEYYRGVEER